MKSILGLGEGADGEDSERKWVCPDEIGSEPSGCLYQVGMLRASSRQLRVKGKTPRGQCGGWKKSGTSSDS